MAYVASSKNSLNKVTDAQKLLSGQRGITNAKIDLQMWSDTLPTDPNQITFKVQKVQGENVSGNSDGGNNNTNDNTNGSSTIEPGKGLIPSDSKKNERVVFSLEGKQSSNLIAS